MDLGQLARDLRRDVALADPMRLLGALGLLDGAQRQAGGALVRCPWHEERTPSCSVRVAPDGTIAAHCYGCNATGDALTLVAIVHGLEVCRDFRTVLALAAKMTGRRDVLSALEHDWRAAPPVLRPLPPPPPSAPERTYPPGDEVAAVWALGVEVSTDAEAATMLRARGIPPEHVGPELARVLPRDTGLPAWARFRGSWWTATGHRLLVPVFDAEGNARSLRAWRIVDGDTPKRLPPAGHRASALVLACPLGRAMLAGAPFGYALTVVVAEGEPDWLTWAARTSDADETPRAVLGVTSGAWTAEHAARIPDGATVVLRTDRDAAGDKYAAETARSLRGRDVRVLRPRPVEVAA